MSQGQCNKNRPIFVNSTSNWFIARLDRDTDNHEKQGTTFGQGKL